MLSPGVISFKSLYTQIASFLTSQIPPSRHHLGGPPPAAAANNYFRLYGSLFASSLPSAFPPSHSLSRFLSAFHFAVFCSVLFGCVSFILSAYFLFSPFRVSHLSCKASVGTNTTSYSFTFGLFWQYAVVCAYNEDERNNLVNRLDLRLLRRTADDYHLFDTIFATTPPKDHLPSSSVVPLYDQPAGVRATNGIRQLPETQASTRAQAARL